MDLTSKIFNLPIIPRLIVLFLIFAIPVYILYRMFIPSARIALVETTRTSENCRVSPLEVVPSNKCSLSDNVPGFLEFSYTCSDGHQGEVSSDSCLSYSDADLIIRSDCASVCAP